MKELKFLLPYVVFTAFSYFFAKDGLGFASPFVFMGLRYLIAGAMLLSISRRIILTKSLLFLSVVTVTSTVFWAYGLLYVSPSESAVLSYSMPLFSLPIAFLLVSEKPSRMEILGIVIGFAGVLIYGIPLLSGFTLVGMVLTVINAFFWGTFTVFYRKLKDQDPVAVNATQFIVGAGIMLALSPLDFHLRITTGFLIDLAWMGTLGGALQFLLWNYMIRISKVNRITVLAFSVPIFTVVLEAFMTSRIPGIFSIAGVVVMFTGIFLSRIRGGISVVVPEGNAGNGSS
ncbi:MAG: DMT family transporter [Candidatus Thermoplasmatota archaeon]|nr:DMT family transporter [Candidatus Thermoplasmatota archaeon]